MLSTLFALLLFSFSFFFCNCYKYLSVTNSYFHRRNYIYHNAKSSLLVSTIFEEEANAIIEPAAKSFLDAIQYSLLTVPTYISSAPLSTSYLIIQSEGTYITLFSVWWSDFVYIYMLYVICYKYHWTTIICSASVTSIYSHIGKSGNKRLPFVLLHGFDSSLLEFRRFARLLAKATRRDVFIPDILGWGFINCSSVVDVSPKAKLEHLKCFIEQIVGGPCVLVLLRNQSIYLIIRFKMVIIYLRHYY